MGAREGVTEDAVMGGALARAEVRALGAPKEKGLEAGGAGLAATGVGAGGERTEGVVFEKKLGMAALAGGSVLLENLTVAGVRIVVVEGPCVLGARGVAAGAPKLNGFDGEDAPVAVAGVTVKAGVCTSAVPLQAVAASFSGSFFCSFSSSFLNLPSSTSSRRLFSSSPTAR